MASTVSSHRLAQHYDRLARYYDATLDHIERWLLADWRSWAAAHAGSRTLEIAIGTGRTLRYYPRDIMLVGVELSQGMLRRADQRRHEGPRRTVLVRGDAQALPLRDESLDAVISILSLCTIPDERQALAEAYRVLRPGGRLVLVEHVRSPVRILAAVQRLIDPLIVRFACDHLTREPLDLLPSLGFQVRAVDRRRLGIIERVLAEKPSAGLGSR